MRHGSSRTIPVRAQSPHAARRSLRDTAGLDEAMASELHAVLPTDETGLDPLLVGRCQAIREAIADRGDHVTGGGLPALIAQDVDYRVKVVLKGEQHAARR